MISVNIAGNSISVLLGNGDGTFQPKQDYSVGSTPRLAAISDVNGDGCNDVAVANIEDNTVR
jgi:FG-GAP-like repeat